MNHEGVWRTAPVTPGLLTIYSTLFILHFVAEQYIILQHALANLNELSWLLVKGTPALALGLSALARPTLVKG